MGVVQSVTCTVPVLASGWEGLSFFGTAMDDLTEDSRQTIYYRILSLNPSFVNALE